MKVTWFIIAVMAAVVLLVMANGANAMPCPSFMPSCAPPRPAPAPLLGAGLWGFALLGGGAGLRQLWMKFVRRG